MTLTNFSNVNPTMVNGEALVPEEGEDPAAYVSMVLYHNDTFVVADRAFRFEYAAAAVGACPCAFVPLWCAFFPGGAWFVVFDVKCMCRPSSRRSLTPSSYDTITHNHQSTHTAAKMTRPKPEEEEEEPVPEEAPEGNRRTSTGGSRRASGVDDKENVVAKALLSPATGKGGVMTPG